MTKDLTPEQRQEYNSFVKASVADGSYFKDARDWYVFRYVQPICERTILFFIAIISGFITYVLVMTLSNSFPVVEEVPIVIRPKDQTRYIPIIRPLNNSIDLENIDQAVSKYLITRYVKKREGYNFRNTNLQDLNNQLNYIENNSSPQEYKNFLGFLSKDNQNSPIKYFGKDFQRIVDINSIIFKKKEVDNLFSKAIKFVNDDLPTDVEIKYTINTKINSVNVSSEKYLARIKFKFSGVNAKKDQNLRLGFSVLEYKIYRVK